VSKKTPLYDLHLKAQAKMVEFGGWDMPLHYGSQLQEHHLVRQQAGVFDVSHMGIVDLHGLGAANYLRYVLANNIDRLVPGKALYTCMLNEQGGVIDDLIVYKIKEDFYRLVINAGTRDKDIAWLKKHLASFDVILTERTDLAMLAIQGPAVQEKLAHFFAPEQVAVLQQLKPFTATFSGDWLVGRTGYTGEEGVEIMLPNAAAQILWQDLVAAQIAPCGLGARDTLRLEAGLNLYGADMDESTTPLESNLGWTVAWEPQERKFIGREALAKQRDEGVPRRMIGLVLVGAGIIRNHQKVFVEDTEIGEVTSGGYSPTLEKSIALARVSAAAVLDAGCFIEIRHKRVPAKVIKPPFVRQGKQVF
jgi:aminomethyltransferase